MMLPIECQSSNAYGRFLQLIFFTKFWVDIFSLLGDEIFGTPREVEAGYFKGSIV